MRGIIVVETQAEFDRWIAGKTPQYLVAHPDKNPKAKAAAAAADTTKPTAALMEAKPAAGKK